MVGPQSSHLSLRVLGFPVHIRPGFIVFLGLVIVVNGGKFGLWIAGSAAVLTLLHELGHYLGLDGSRHAAAQHP